MIVLIYIEDPTNKGKVNWCDGVIYIGFILQWPLCAGWKYNLGGLVVIIFGCYCCLLCLLGVRGYFSLEKRPRDCGFTNRRNKGLISVDRRTSLLSYLQYPVPYQSRLQRIYRSQCPKGDWMWCWAEAYRYAWTQGAVDIVAFQHRFWLRGVQSLSCRW